MAQAGGLATRFAPSFSLIRAHFILGIVGLLVLSLGLLGLSFGLTGTPSGIGGHYAQAHLIAIVHATVLGWIVSTAFGSMHQLIPVVFEVPVRSEKVAWLTFWLYAISVGTLVSLMWFWKTDSIFFPLSAIGAALAIWLYIINLGLTLVKSTVRSVTGAYVVMSLIYLAIAVVIGALLAWNFYAPFLPINHIDVLKSHAHLAGFGFLAMLVMGVAYRLMEMFLLSHGAKEHYGKAAFYASNLAVVSLAFGFWFASYGLGWLIWLGTGAAFFTVVTFILQAKAIWIRKMRRRAIQEVAWKHSLLSYVYFFLVVSLGVVLLFLPAGELKTRLTLVYGLLFLLGFLGTIVIGQMYKILPFLVWLHRFSRLVGLMKVPSANDMLGERPKLLQFIFMHSGILALCLGILFESRVIQSIGAILFFISSLLITLNLGLIHSRKP